MAADPPPSEPGPAVAAGPATMLELGAALGADVWWLEQVFALAGAWVADTREAAVRVHLAELSRVAGDHALALRGLLPRPAPVDPAAWVAPPTGGAADIVASLGVAGAAESRLALLHRVLLPRLLASWGAPMGPSADGAARAVRHARTDLAELRDQGEGLLQALLVDRRTVGVAHAAALQLEEELVTSGGMRPPPPDIPPV
ncbi:hypothetical protein HC251_21060 [Iamia sp. SCSIO 61187]|uniref:hypothetical protein n=1 Tax=Iamia sp. SCSIO 61187 TaxID=2722752 RepID=UPI001C63948F|nr:hypothetical protein [Iamia sp. SCSIO 61187]QYG94677.1 hypothetical protein HC251_21060 [Iamia sp. SCSIO 61187]